MTYPREATDSGYRIAVTLHHPKTARQQVKLRTTGPWGIRIGEADLGERLARGFHELVEPRAMGVLMRTASIGFKTGQANSRPALIDGAMPGILGAISDKTTEAIFTMGAWSFQNVNASIFEASGIRSIRCC